jgi:branched-chain amino acid transport system substrate-binding protein
VLGAKHRRHVTCLHVVATGLLLSLSIGLSACRRSETAGLPVVIAATIPLTGDAASYGEIQKRGITLALKKINRDSNSPLLKVVYKDTQLIPREAVNALEQSLLQDHPQVVFSISTAEVLAQAPICNQRKVVLLSPLASGDEISKAGPFVFRVAPSDSFQGRAMADKVLSLGLKRVGILYVNDSFGVGLALKFRGTLEKGGGTVVDTETVDPGQMDMRTQLEKLRAARPEGLFLILHPGEAVAVLKQVKQLGIHTRLFGADTFSNRDIYTAAQNEAQGVMFTLPAEPDSPAFKQFKAEYETAYHTPADINAADAYDATMLVSRAVQAGARTGDQIRQFFDQRQPYDGASGLIQWDEDGDVISKKYQVYVVRGSGYQPLP